eukprot:47280_1
MKAIWYQGINDAHNVQPNQPIQIDHVLALIVYAQFTDLCTKFRETYRKISMNESVIDQIKRHSTFANFGKLLYEAFAFYGSTASQVDKLYHGMSIELLFNTLYCTFDSPTSTTTSSSAA